MTQSRFVCHECHRQWVHAQNWTLGMNCPACGSQSPTLETYTPTFPGSDYGATPVADAPTASPIHAEESLNIAHLLVRGVA